MVLKQNKMEAKTLFDKIWERHVVESLDATTDVLYIDRHYIHEVTSPQAFDELKNKSVQVFRKEKTSATVDHNVPTINQHLPIENEASRLQIAKLYANVKEQDIECFPLLDDKNGIVHVIGPEQGLTQPGMTIVCGDSHTSTHGAFGTIAFGIGTSQVAQVLASQCVLVTKPKKMRISVSGKLKSHVSAKDVILYIISNLGTDSGTGYFIEYAGNVIVSFSMEERMTVCNMSIEMGAKGGLIGVDETTLNYFESKFGNEFIKKDWKEFKSDNEAVFDIEYEIDASKIDTMITYGTNPGMGVKLSESIPCSNNQSDEKALSYMGFRENESLVGTEINYVFIGSCTNGRYEDFELVGEYIKGKKKAENVKALLVPGSNAVLAKIKSTGLEKVFNEAGFEFRQPGCSACLAMNGDTIPKGEYCVSTSNRNFEGRQGAGARTLLASPVLAAVTAIEGKIVNTKTIEEWKN